MSDTQAIPIQEKTAEMPDYGGRSDLQALLKAAEDAEKRYDHETAVARYNAALELPDLTLQEQYHILDGRATVHRHWQNIQRFAEDVEALIALAREMNDKELLAETTAVYGFHLMNTGPGTPPEEFAREAVALAEELDSDRLLGYACITLGQRLYQNGDPETGWQSGYRALECARRSGDGNVLFYILDFFVAALVNFNQIEEAQRFAAEAYVLAVESGSLYKQYRAFSSLANAETDLAQKRNLEEQALAISHVANASLHPISSANNLGLLLWRLGLYGRALAYAREAVGGAAPYNVPSWSANMLDGLGRAYLGKGQLAEAEETFHKGLALRVPHTPMQAIHMFGLANVALARGDWQEAIDHFQEAITNDPTLEPISQSGLSVAYLALGETDRSLQLSTKAVALLEEAGLISEFHSHEIWLRHFQVLNALDSSEAFDALQKAKQFMLSQIENLSDEGLRRNYLNKVPSNRDITLTWVTEATLRDIPLGLFTAHKPQAGNLREQFRRVVDIGNRFTAQHDPHTLADFIVEEFVEMSGAERALLLLLDNDGVAQTVASFNPEDAVELAALLLEEMQHGRLPLLLTDVKDVGDVGEVPEGAVPEIHQRSVIALPLITQGQLLGLLYGDMRQIFGRFDEGDKNLLGMLANQAAAALENADLVSTLEEKVVERTADLEQRNSELASLAEVGRDISATLELTAVLERIAGHALDLLDVSDSVIFLPDESGEAMRALIALGSVAEQMQAFEVHPGAGILGDIWQRRQAELINDPANDPRGVTVAGTGSETDERMMATPLLSGEDIVGLMAVWRNGAPFTADDLRFLDGLARQAAIAIQNAQLYSDAELARAAAIKANESKSAFLSNMSHELRTPLNAIIGFSRIVSRKSKDCLPQKQQDNLGKILSSGEHLLGLINTILDIAKIEAGRMDVNESRFQINPLLENLAMTAQPLLRRDVVFKTEIAPDLPPLVTDQDKVKQILLNLLSNAAKFTHEGSITISARPGTFRDVSTFCDSGVLDEAPPQMVDCLAIQVVDTGIGISEEALGRIFEEFQQADELTRRHYGGTGLGLSISKQLAHLLGGDITAVSQPGKGSTFTLYLPLESEKPE